MSLRYLSYYERRFLLSNRFVQLILGLHPSQSSTNQLLQWSVIAVYLIPMIAHQVKVSFLNLYVVVIIINFISVIVIIIISYITVISFALILNYCLDKN